MIQEIKQIEALLAKSKSTQDLERIGPLIKKLPDDQQKTDLGNTFAQLWMRFKGK